MALKNGEEHFRSNSGVDVYRYANRALHGFHLSLFVRAGSMHESEENSGVSHFFEHAAIRNINRIMNGELYSLLDAHGIEFNASTYSEMIQFYVGGAAKNFALAAEVLIKVLSPIILTSDEVSMERARIKAEIRESDERTSLTSFTNSAVHGTTSLARSITGTLGSVNGISRKRLAKFGQRALVAENIFFYATGCVSDADINSLLSLIDTSPVGHGTKNQNVAPVPSYFGKRVPQIHVKNADFTMIRFTFDLDMSRVTLAESDLLYDIILGGYNSDFFIELSEKRGLFYDVSGSLERYENIGTLSFCFEIKENALYDSVEKTVGILSDMKKKLLPESRCMRAAYVDNAHMLLDDARELNFTFAYDNHIMNASYSDIDGRIAAYSAVTPERIRCIANEIFRAQNLTFTMKGKSARVDRERLISLLSRLDA